jgi:putative DNA primase/helicase
MTQPPVRTFKCTDLGNAERLVAHYGDDLHYCHPYKKWLCWDGTRWRLDDSGAPGRAAKLTVRSIYGEALAVQGDDDDAKAYRKALAAWAARSEADARIKAMLARATSEADLVVFPTELDADPWLLNCENGTLDLRSGQLRPHDHNDLITKLCPVAYDPTAEAPTWEKFLTRVMDADADLTAFLQRAVGYSLTGDISEHCLFIPHGAGRNGKSVFLGTIRALLGDHAQQLPRETLMARHRGGEIPNDIARLAGARLATAIETRQGQRLDEEMVKQLTGGDPVTARFLHGEFFEFHPVAKLWLATNHKPKITGTDEGIWSRVRLVPFDVTIPPGERDRHLADKLKAELPGILNWAIEGCLDWQQRGIDPPALVVDVNEDYRREEDTLAEFIEQCCVTGPSEHAYPKDLHDAYVAFTGERVSQQELGKLLHTRGYDSGKLKHKRVWFGIGLPPVTEPGTGDR